MIARRTFVILLSVLAIPASGRSGSVDATLNKAKEALDASKYREAISLASEVIRTDPKKTEAWYVRGLGFSRDHQDELAIKDFTEALRQDPKHSKALLGRAEIFYFEKAWDRAITDLNLAIRHNDRDPELHRLRALSRYETEDYQSVIADLKEAIRLEPKGGGNYAILANVYSTCPEARYRDGAKAIQNANKAFELSKFHVESVAAAYAEAGKFDEAVKWQTKAIEIFKSREFTSLVGPAEGRLEKYKRREPLRYRSNSDWGKRD